MKSVRLLSLVSLALTTGAGAALSAHIPQSPVDFVDANIPMKAGPVLTFGGYNGAFAWEAQTTRSGMGKTESIKVKPKGAKPTLKYNNVEYMLNEIHFHIHSEHTKDGLIRPMEMHMVHEHVVDPNDPKKSLFLAIGRWILDGGTEDQNSPLNPIFDNLPALPPQGMPPSTKAVPGFMLPKLIPGDRSLYQYEGSLTTSLKEEVEGDGQLVSSQAVSWVMFKEALVLPRAQIDKFRAHHQNGNWRETQAIVPGDKGHRLTMGKAVPEPSTVWLLGVAGLVGAGRRRRW